MFTKKWNQATEISINYVLHLFFFLRPAYTKNDFLVISFLVTAAAAAAAVSNSALSL